MSPMNHKRRVLCIDPQKTEALPYLVEKSVKVQFQFTADDYSVDCYS